MYNGGYDLTTNSVTSNSAADFFSNLETLSAGLVVFTVFVGLIAIAIAVFLIIADCKMFKKAGESWWKALIPFYSTWVEAKIAGLAWWWCPIMVGVASLATFKNLSTVAGIITLIISFNFYYNISKKFGKSNGFAVLCTFLPVIGIPILAFGSAKYNADAKTDKNGIFAVEKDIAK